MSIRMIAKDLYHLIREVEKIEQRLAEAPIEKREELENRLRKTKTERDRIRRMLEGSKG